MSAPEKHILDTNLIVDALRTHEGMAKLDAFRRKFLPSEYFSAVVAHELRAGCRTPESLATIVQDVIGPYERVGRIVTPSWNAWTQAGTALADIAKRDGVPIKDMPRSFTNDVLIAVSCREAGMTLVTSNTKDFERIAKVLKFKWTPAWPK